MRRKKSENIKSKRKDAVVIVLTVAVSLAIIFAGHSLFSDYSSEYFGEEEVYKAKIISIDSVEETVTLFGSVDKLISFTARITSGRLRGMIISCTQTISGMIDMQDKAVGEGDKILTANMDITNSGNLQWVFTGYNRVDALIFLCGAFLLIVAVIGFGKGICTIISLALTCLIIFFVYLPSILSGVNVYFSTACAAVIITVMSLLLINGVNKKTVCAILGTIGGVLVTAVLALFMNRTMKMTGYIDENYVFLVYVNSDKPLDLISIVWGGMVLGALGAVMDVAMTIASSMNELAEHMQERSFLKMVRSGMNIGRDAIGTMSNTLILAYMGSSLALVLLLISYTRHALYLFSLEMIAIQVVQALAGSMGILFAVPFSAVFAAYLYNRKEKPRRDIDFLV